MCKYVGCFICADESPQPDPFFYGHPMYISDIIFICSSAKIIIYHKKYLLGEKYIRLGNMKSIDKKWWRHKLQITRFSRIFQRFDFFMQYIGIVTICAF